MCICDTHREELACARFHSLSRFAANKRLHGGCTKQNRTVIWTTNTSSKCAVYSVNVYCSFLAALGFGFSVVVLLLSSVAFVSGSRVFLLLLLFLFGFDLVSIWPEGGFWCPATQLSVCLCHRGWPSSVRLHAFMQQTYVNVVHRMNECLIASSLVDCESSHTHTNVGYATGT